ncbi:MAG: transketolase [Candidatus Eisenbacteria bacterium]
MSATPSALDLQCANTIRFLAADMVEKAKSGHPGMPMGMADAAYVLWTRFLRYEPSDTKWAGRDRFVLSAGHGSALHYALLHLAGFDLPIEELQRFRQLGSRTPGHPEWSVTPGVETTTGPLAQGIGNMVGMALSQHMAAARFNSEDFAPSAWRVFGIAGDGCMMEGLSHEAASLAGHLGLGNLVLFYDDNRITIEGETDLAYSDDAAKRFEAYGWHVERANAYDHEAIATAISRSLTETTRPSLVILKSHIGYGAPHKQDTRQAHGEPLGAEEMAGAKQKLGWPESPSFLVPESVRTRFAERARENRKAYDAWQASFAAWRATHAQQAELWDAITERRVPSDLMEQLCAQAPTTVNATRNHGNAVLQVAAAIVPALIGGSADLEPSTKTRIKDSASITRSDFSGRNLHFGIREHGMGAIINGLALSGGWIPYGSSFLVFTDYARPAIRLSALMRQPCVWVFTHDSVFVGEDGPTHQPVEHLAAMRTIPNLVVVRPADGLETAAAWGLALERKDGPTLLALSRQNCAVLQRPATFHVSMLRRGGYVVRDAAGTDVITLIATGSEVGVAVDAAERLSTYGFAVRVVSMLAPQLFLQQDAAWRDQVLPPEGRRVSLEAGTTDYWRRFVGESGLCVGIDVFGESAPAEQLAEHFGLTSERVARRIHEWAVR